MSQKKTMVIGVSEKTDRYSNIAVRRLTAAGYPVVAVGLKEGKVEGVPILTGFPKEEDVDTVTLYVGPANQPAYMDYILSLSPRRIIFNPGTENPEFEAAAEAKGIETLEACTLTMLAVGNY